MKKNFFYKTRLQMLISVELCQENVGKVPVSSPRPFGNVSFMARK